ncbi:hypothetical protein O1611_g500 [Lasiodiplodia mahajangana]|uniref:Uncharacterized protein n=1 Tax=Lasiodiplodia mahajangana TaxID=1108764 RepID=A0ACC2K0D1_9PEZI|nr:hypothetical protein O1611_g500 [Lasiodiplodia mahajangana]
MPKSWIRTFSRHHPPEGGVLSLGQLLRYPDLGSALIRPGDIPPPSEYCRIKIKSSHKFEKGIAEWIPHENENVMRNLFDVKWGLGSVKLNWEIRELETREFHSCLTYRSRALRAAGENLFMESPGEKFMITGVKIARGVVVSSPMKITIRDRSPSLRVGPRVEREGVECGSETEPVKSITIPDFVYAYRLCDGCDHNPLTDENVFVLDKRAMENDWISSETDSEAEADI